MSRLSDEWCCMNCARLNECLMNESDLNLLDYCVAYREYQPYYLDGFKDGAEWQAKQSIEVLSSILENWVHGGDADCIIAEFEEKLNDMINQIKLKNE